MRPPACTAPGPAATPRTESSRDGAPENRQLADGSSYSLEDAMPRFWLNRRRSDGPTREWDGFRPSDPDQARRQLEQARSIIERAIHLHPKAEAVIRACQQDDAKTGLLAAEGGEVREQYRRLREELRLLDLPSWLAGKLLALRDRLTEVLGQRWWPTGHWEGEPNGHRQR